MKFNYTLATCEKDFSVIKKLNDLRDTSQIDVLLSHHPHIKSKINCSLARKSCLSLLTDMIATSNATDKARDFLNYVKFFMPKVTSSDPENKPYFVAYKTCNLERPQDMNCGQIRILSSSPHNALMKILGNLNKSGFKIYEHNGKFGASVNICTSRHILYDFKVSDASTLCSQDKLESYITEFNKKFGVFIDTSLCICSHVRNNVDELFPFIEFFYPDKCTVRLRCGIRRETPSWIYDPSSLERVAFTFYLCSIPVDEIINYMSPRTLKPLLREYYRRHPEECSDALL